MYKNTITEHRIRCVKNNEQIQEIVCSSYLSQAFLVVVKEVIEREARQLVDCKSRHILLRHLPVRRQEIAQARPTKQRQYFNQLRR